MPCYQSSNSCSQNNIRLGKFKLNIKWVPSITWWKVTLNFGNKTNIDLSKIWTWETTWVAWWSTDLVFKADDNNTVSWNDWKIYFPDNTNYTIQSWDTWDMTEITYIYLDEKNSTLLTTTTPQDAVWEKKLLVCVAWPVDDTNKKAIFQAFWSWSQSTFITADNIAANTITANEVAANTLTSNEIKTWTITITDLWDDDYKDWAWYAHDWLNSDWLPKKVIDWTVLENTSPSNTWLFMNSKKMWYYNKDDDERKAYIDNEWNFKFDWDDDNYISWDWSSLTIAWVIDIKDSDNNEIWLWIDTYPKIKFYDSWDPVWYLLWDSIDYNWTTYHLIKSDWYIWSSKGLLAQANNSNLWAVSGSNSWWHWLEWETTKSWDSNNIYAWVFWWAKKDDTYIAWCYWVIDTDDSKSAAIMWNNKNDSWWDLSCVWTWKAWIPYPMWNEFYVEYYLHLYDHKHSSRYSYLKVDDDTWDLQRVDAWWTTHTLATYW